MTGFVLVALVMILLLLGLLSGAAWAVAALVGLVCQGWLLRSAVVARQPRRRVQR